MFIIPQVHVCPVLFGSILQKIGNEHLYVPQDYYQQPLGYQSCVVTNDLFFSPHGATALSAPWPPQYQGSMITLRHTMLSRAPMNQ
jgi:hypothetical protein